MASGDSHIVWIYKEVFKTKLSLYYYENKNLVEDKKIRYPMKGNSHFYFCDNKSFICMIWIYLIGRLSRRILHRIIAKIIQNKMKQNIYFYIIILFKKNPNLFKCLFSRIY